MPSWLDVPAWVDKMDASDWIAGVSLLISVLVLWRQHRSGGRAHFTAAWSGPQSVVYVNHGPGAARNVKPKISGYPISLETDVPHIGAFQRTLVTVIPGADSADGKVELSWRDNRWRQQSIAIHVSRASNQTFTHDDGTLEGAVRSVAREEARRAVDDIDWGL